VQESFEDLKLQGNIRRVSSCELFKGGKKSNLFEVEGVNLSHKGQVHVKE
jgi:hypothetical protein